MSNSKDDRDDWIGETTASIDARLAGASRIQDQIRFGVGVMAIISMMMLIAAYNAYLSYDYAWALEQAQRAFSEKKVAPDILREQALKSWAESRSVVISLVGIRVNVDDAPVLGTTSLFVVSLWLLLLARRENRTIGYLLRDTDSTPASSDGPSISRSVEHRWLIFHSLVSNSLFMNVNRSLARIQSLHPSASSAAETRKSLEELLTRALTAFFFLFPPTACLLMFALDRWSYLRPSPFRLDSSPPGLSGFFWPSMLVFAVCWIPLVVCCWRVLLYVRATETVLGEYFRGVLADIRRMSAERVSTHSDSGNSV